MAADEEPFPDEDGGPNPPYDFFRFGQNALGFHANHVNQPQNNNDINPWGNQQQGDQQQDEVPDLNADPMNWEVQNGNLIIQANELLEFNDQGMQQQGNNLMQDNNSDNSALSVLEINNEEEHQVDNAEPQVLEEQQPGIVLALAAPIDLNLEPLIPAIEPQEAIMQNFLHEEIQEDELMMEGEEDNEEEAQMDEGLHNVQVGILQLLQTEEADPSFQAFSKQQTLNQWIPKVNADSIRLWARFFSPMGQGGPQIPAEWMDYITLKLLQPKNFEWAKHLVTSKAWPILANQSYTFSIPALCPSKVQIQCSSTPGSKINATIEESMRLKVLLTLLFLLEQWAPQ